MCVRNLPIWVALVLLALLLALLLATKWVGLLCLRLGHLVTLPIVAKESSLHLLHMPLVHLLLLLLLLKLLLLVHMLSLVMVLVEAMWKDSSKLLLVLHVLHHMRRRLMHQVVAHHLLRCQVVTSLHLIALILVVLVSSTIILPRMRIFASLFDRIVYFAIFVSKLVSLKTTSILIAHFSFSLLSIFNFEVVDECVGPKLCI